MYASNLTGWAGSIKRMASLAGKIFLGLALLSIPSCSDDPFSVVSADFDYSGTYVATFATETLDSERYNDYVGNNILGLLVIQDTLYSLNVQYAYGSGFFERLDYGTLRILDTHVRFESAEDPVLTSLQSTAEGYYDTDTERIKISYIWDNVLWTEYWKSARPVTDADTTTYLPY